MSNHNSKRCRLRWQHIFTFFLVFIPTLSLAAENTGNHIAFDLTKTWFGIASVIIFVLAYITVMCEEFIHLRKSKPVIVAAGIIWTLVGIAYAMHGDTETAAQAVRENILDYAELLLFLLSAMTYINTMTERNIFKALRAWLITRRFSLRTIFWLTGLLAFFISPVADNMTTALIMAAVIMAVGAGNTTFIAVSCINIVIAANAGGAYSPFGDITTLMVWQHGTVEFFEFFDIFIPSAINWLVPAIIMSFAVSKDLPDAVQEDIRMKPGAFVVVGLFILTICMAVTMHNYLNLPPVLGMMTGLGLLKFYGYFLRRDELSKWHHHIGGPEDERDNGNEKPFDIFISMKRAEWDTLMFFYGVVLCVGGLGTIGYLAHVSEFIYGDLGPTTANIMVGILSAIIDNIPIMFAVITMDPHMSHGQWLLVTMTAGVGGSLFSIGSAAGVALMGQARGVYTFFSHLKWTWAIALGYAASIYAHLIINSHLMNYFK